MGDLPVAGESDSWRWIHLPNDLVVRACCLDRGGEFEVFFQSAGGVRVASVVVRTTMGESGRFASRDAALAAASAAAAVESAGALTAWKALEWGRSVFVRPVGV